MPLYKFKEGDVLRNRIKAHPKNHFLLASGSVFYNKEFPETRTLDPGASNYLNHISNGDISLFEMNVDRPSGELIYPFMVKGGSLGGFRTVSVKSFQTSNYGDILSSSISAYPMSASISYDYVSDGTSPTYGSRARIKALKNTLNFYKKNSQHYAYSSSVGDKSQQSLTLLSIPSIFYGSSIKKGTVKLNYYVSGSLAGELRDNRQNGELVQVLPVQSESGSVAGMVLYNEGFIVLTGSWVLNATALISVEGGTKAAQWKHFGAGHGSGTSNSASWGLQFEGINYTSVLTMLAHAPKGYLNHSNNPTFIQHLTNSSGVIRPQQVYTGSTSYIEDERMSLTNLVSASYNEPSASFRKHTYISRIGIYDKNKNLIAVAKTATPVKKTEEREYTFKLKIDI
jgi:hypothetical protein